MRFGFASLITKVLQKSSQYRARTSFPTFIVVEVDDTEGLFTTAVKVGFFSFMWRKLIVCNRDMVDLSMPVT